LDTEKLCAIATRLGPKFEVVADFSATHHSKFFENKADDVFSILKRSPCYLSGICSGLGIDRNEALKYISHLQ
jgi:hypothetical protein